LGFEKRFRFASLSSAVLTSLRTSSKRIKQNKVKQDIRKIKTTKQKQQGKQKKQQKVHDQNF
jgi:hypothetical protein